MTMSWIYLFAAGLLEIGWPIGLKLAGQASTRLLGISIALGFMAGSGVLLMLATRAIPIGTAYAIWTGIGAAGTFIIGVMFFGDPTSALRYLGVAMIVGGVAVLKLAS
jgi:quaternary ammonium compound-resistance protein SugE